MIDGFAGELKMKKRKKDANASLASFSDSPAEARV